MRDVKIDIKKQNGFTMVELLAVLGVIVVVGAVASAIIVSSLRAASKANQVNIVRQNGNFALLQMSRTIRYAKSFAGVSTDNSSYLTDCSLPSPAPNPTPVPTRYSSVKVILFDDTQVTFSCVPPSASRTISESINSGSAKDLIDINSVSVKDCYFTCSQNFRTDSPSIGINLILSQASTTNLTDKTSTIPFGTSVTMRNSNK